MKSKERLRLVSEETGLCMDLAVVGEISMKERQFYILTMQEQADDQGWAILMEDPAKDLCVLEKIRDEGGTVYERVTPEVMQEVIQQFI